MLSRRTMLDLMASCIFFTTADVAIAKNPHHKNGQSLLGAKLKQNGRHQIDKAGQATVSADVNNGKVTTMDWTSTATGTRPTSSSSMAAGSRTPPSISIHVTSNRCADRFYLQLRKCGSSMGMPAKCPLAASGRASPISDPGHLKLTTACHWRIIFV